MTVFVERDAAYADSNQLIGSRETKTKRPERENPGMLSRPVLVGGVRNLQNLLNHLLSHMVARSVNLCCLIYTRRL